MKHGPIAHIDALPVVAICADDHVYEKMLSNIQEAKARGGLLEEGHAPLCVLAHPLLVDLDADAGLLRERDVPVLHGGVNGRPAKGRRPPRIWRFCEYHSRNPG